MKRAFQGRTHDSFRRVTRIQPHIPDNTIGYSISCSCIHRRAAYLLIRRIGWRRNLGIKKKSFQAASSALSSKILDMAVTQRSLKTSWQCGVICFTERMMDFVIHSSSKDCRKYRSSWSNLGDPDPWAESRDEQPMNDCCWVWIKTPCSPFLPSPRNDWQQWVRL